MKRRRLDFEGFAENILGLYLQDTNANISPTDIFSAGEASGLLSYWNKAEGKETDGTGAHDVPGYSSEWKRYDVNKQHEIARLAKEESEERAELSRLKAKYEGALEVFIGGPKNLE